MMLAEWMLQATVLGALFSAAAVLLEPVLVRRRRAVWLTAMALSASAPVLALLAPAVWPDWLSWRVAPALPVPAAPPYFGEVTRKASGQGAVVHPVAIAWTVLSLLCLGRYVEGWLRLGQVRRGCVRVRVAGRELLLSERLGPAVVGLWRPHIVAPQWIVNVSAARQRMIVLHEAEHVRAGDQWVLAAAPLLAVLLPWNPSLWWQLRRLRLAVELDCDARVLSRGVRPLEYGGLLLDVAGSAATVLAPALAEPRSLLARRIDALLRRPTRPDPSRCAALVVAAVVAVVLGCVAAAPVRVVSTTTPAAATAESVIVSTLRAARTSKQPNVLAGSDTTWRSGVAAAAERSDESSRTRTADVAVTRSKRVTQPVPLGSPADGTHALELSGERPVTADSALPAPRKLFERAGDAPLIVIDGVIIAGGSLSGLGVEPDDINSIEVIKGAAAVARYGTRGADGVITITTRRDGAAR